MTPKNKKVSKRANIPYFGCCFFSIRTTQYECFFFLQQQQKECKVKCCVCSNVMAASSFLKHKETKHSLLSNVKYIKLIELDDQQSPEAMAKIETPVTMIKCKYCPNKIPSDGMERHLLRSHIECNICGIIIMKANLERHTERKHGVTTPDASETCNSLSPSPSDRSIVNEPQSIPVRQSQSQPKVPEFIYINEYQLGAYLRQKRVYTKDGYLYLRNVDHVDY